MTPNLVSHFRMLGRYNRLANARLHDACSELDDEERKRDRDAFFGSIHGTLNHILVGDRIWMTRFEGGEAASTNLDAILYEDFDALREARNVEDARIEAYTSRLTAGSLAGTIVYVNNEGREFRDPPRGSADTLLQPPDPPSRPGDGDALADRGALPCSRHAPRPDPRTGQAGGVELMSCAAYRDVVPARVCRRGLYSSAPS